MKIRVHFQDDSTEDYPANHVEIAGEGSLWLTHRSQKQSPITDAAGRHQIEINQTLIRIIRRDLWAEVELVEVGEPEIIEIGDRQLARVN